MSRSCLAELMMSLSPALPATNWQRLLRNTGIPFLRALSCRANGAVLLAEGDARSALVELRHSWSIWCELQAPYEAARVRLQIALASRKLGDEEGALLELTAARQTFQELDAVVDLAQAESLLSKDGQKPTGPLVRARRWKFSDSLLLASPIVALRRNCTLATRL